MQLLIATGSAHSNWLEVVDALQSEYEYPGREATTSFEHVNRTLIENGSISNDVLLSSMQNLDSNKAHLVAHQNFLPNLKNWVTLGDSKFVVFYSSPHLALANALTEQDIVKDDCYRIAKQWSRQVKEIYSFYKKYKKQCILLDVQDTCENLDAASHLISQFSGKGIRVNATETTATPETLLAAKLLLIEQDELFDLYDEVRSCAPLFGEFVISSVAETSSLSDDALGAVKLARCARESALCEQSSMRKLSDEQLAAYAMSEEKLKAEIMQNRKQLQSLEECSEQQKQVLSEKNTAILDLQMYLAKASKDNISSKELYELQVTQLQEELVQQSEVLEQQRVLQIRIDEKSKSEQSRFHESLLLKERAHEKQTRDLRSQLEAGRDKQELLARQIAEQDKIVEELSTELGNLQESGRLKDKAAQKREQNALNQLEVGRIEQELLGLQVAQLQEEMRATIIEQRACAKSLQIACNSLENLETEREIAALQISQLQEELEYYYLLLKEETIDKAPTSACANHVLENTFERCHIESLAIVGGYTTDGYQDVHIQLHDVSLGDGRAFERLNVKLIEVNGHPGLEFRPSEQVEESPALQWREDMQDEYGSFIVFVPIPGNRQASLQHQLNQGLCASDRILISGIAMALAEVFQPGRMNIHKELPPGKILDWRLSAISLKNQVLQLPACVSFDSLSLVEEHRGDNCEFLSLEFVNLLIADVLYPRFNIRFSAIDLVEDQTHFALRLILELRDQANNQAPLQAWPPILQDDYGCKFQAVIDLAMDTFEISVEEKVSDRDVRFLRLMANNLTNFLQALVAQGQSFERHPEDWLSIGRHINEMVAAAAIPHTSQQTGTGVKIEPQFDFYEHVDLGGYQHIVFKNTLADSRELQIKLKAENINPISRVADISLELRTGDDRTPLTHTPFFGEDSYGPRVLIPFKDIHSVNNAEQQDDIGAELVSSFMANIEQLIRAISDFDQEQQTLWSALIESN